MTRARTICRSASCLSPLRRLSRSPRCSMRASSACLKNATWLRYVLQCYSAVAWLLLTLSRSCQFRALLSAVRTRLRARGMHVLDAFRAFDQDRNGLINCTELYSGLDWCASCSALSSAHSLVLQAGSDAGRSRCVRDDAQHRQGRQGQPDVRAVLGCVPLLRAQVRQDGH